jgi:hypothetical protein
MSINPTSPHGPRHADPAALEAARAAQAHAAQSAAKPADPTDSDGSRAEHDSVEVSNEAKALATSPAREAASSLPADRLTEIGERLATGYYDQPDVIEQLARKLSGHPDLQ